MNLITIHKQEVTRAEEVNSVNARDLYKHLEVKQEFANWIKNQFERGGLEDGVDYVLLDNNVMQKQGSGGHNAKDYLLTVDAAKHIAMMSGTQKGKEVRDYFIEIEKQYHSLREVLEAATEKFRLGMPQQPNKRRVGTALTNKEKAVSDMGFQLKWNDAQIARVIGCDPRTVGKYRANQEEEAQERTLSLLDMEDEN